MFARRCSAYSVAALILLLRPFKKYGDSWTAFSTLRIISLRKYILTCISNTCVEEGDVTCNWIYCHGFAQDFKPSTKVSRLCRLKCSWMPAMVCWNITRKDWREQRLKKGRRSQKKNLAKLICSLDGFQQGQLMFIYTIYVVGQWTFSFSFIPRHPSHPLSSRSSLVIPVIPVIPSYLSGPSHS